MEYFYRFELAFDGEPQGVGFLQGLDETGIPGQEVDGLYELFEKLPAPRNCSGTSFWFTRSGLSYFSGSINAVIAVLADYNWQLLSGMMEDDLVNSVYHDEYQAAFAAEYLQTDYTKFVAVSQAKDALLLTDPC